jgi:hypothetical protein
MKHLKLSACVLLMPLFSSAQGVRIQSASASVGLLPQLDFGANVNQIKNLSPNDPFWTQNFPSPNVNNYNNGINTLAKFAVCIAAKKPQTKAAKHGLLRIALIAGNTKDFQVSNNYEKLIRQDTLISSTTGKTYFVDSATNYNNNISIGNSSLGLEVASMFATNDYHGFKLYGGMSIGYQSSVSSTSRSLQYINISKIISEQEYQILRSNGSYSSSSLDSRMETVGGKSTLIIGLPIGIELSLMPKSNRAKGLNLTYEASPSYVSGNWSGVNLTATTLGLGHQFGVKLNM